MSGTVEGGKWAAKTNKWKYGEDFYARIGSKGGKASGTGGFYDRRPWYQKAMHPKNPAAVEAGRKGGKISRKTKKG